MLVYGKNVARDLLKSDYPIKEVFVQDNFNDNEIIDLIKNRNLPIKYKTKQQINDLSDG